MTEYLPRQTERASPVQVLTLDPWPSPRQVEVLGPNSGTFSPFVVDRERQRIHAQVKVACILQQIEPVAPPVRITLRYVFGERRQRDVDNFTTIGKAVIDGLVKSEILAGDDAAQLSLRVEIATERQARRLEVIIEREPR